MFFGIFINKIAVYAHILGGFSVFVVRKNTLIVIGILVVCFFVSIFSINALAGASQTNLSPTGLTVVIDAGHGGIDGGVSGVKTGVTESELNLSVAFCLQECFKSAGVKTVLTRTDENGLYGVYNDYTFKRRDMENRRKIIEKAKPDLVISIHMNKFSTASRRGAQVFFDESNEKGVLLAKSVQQSLNAMPECVKQTSALKGDYYILNSHPYPACIVECGFLSNPDDETLLLTEEYRQKIAYAIFKGSIDYLSKVTCFGEESANSWV